MYFFLQGIQEMNKMIAISKFDLLGKHNINRRFFYIDSNSLNFSLCLGT